MRMRTGMRRRPAPPRMWGLPRRGVRVEGITFPSRADAEEYLLDEGYTPLQIADALMEATQ